jgi:hypothetical protein
VLSAGHEAPGRGSCLRVRTYASTDWLPANADICVSACALLFDMLLLGLSFTKATHVWRAGRRVPLLSLIVRDGVWAFLAVCGLFFLLRRDVTHSCAMEAVFVLNDTLFRKLAPPLSSFAWPCVHRARLSPFSPALTSYQVAIRGRRGGTVPRGAPNACRGRRSRARTDAHDGDRPRAHDVHRRA